MSSQVGILFHFVVEFFWVIKYLTNRFYVAMHLFSIMSQMAFVTITIQPNYNMESISFT